MRSERTEFRYKALLRQFVSVHGKNPSDLYARYILDCITDLGEVYDENHLAIRGAIRMGRAKNIDYLNTLYARAEKLNDLGHMLRDALNLTIRDTNHKEFKDEGERAFPTTSTDHLKMLKNMQAEEC